MATPGRLRERGSCGPGSYSTGADLGLASGWCDASSKLDTERVADCGTPACEPSRDSQTSYRGGEMAFHYSLKDRT